MNPFHGTRNRVLIYAASSVRAAATSLAAVLAGIYLARLGFSTAAVGLVVAAGLAGSALAALAATFGADRFGRRRSLFALGILCAGGGLIVALGSNAVILSGAAFFGMLNGMGKDRGAALAIEQAILPSTVSDERRTSIFAFYNALQSVGAALGALMAGAPNLLSRFGAPSEIAAMRATMAGYAVLMGVMAALYAGLTEDVEVNGGLRTMPVSPDTRRVVAKLSALFTIDSLGGGFLTRALIALFFAERFGIGAAATGALFFAASVANGVSQLLAPPLARRIGLVNTMVFTHLPANLLLMVAGFATNFPLAAGLFLLSECMIQMDVPARQSYVMAVVKPEERIFASGVTGLVRLAGWVVGPGIAGTLMQGLSLGTPLVVGPGLKITYDLLLYRSFRELRPPEEIAAQRAALGRGQRARATNP